MYFNARQLESKLIGNEIHYRKKESVASVLLAGFSLIALLAVILAIGITLQLQ